MSYRDMRNHIAEELCLLTKGKGVLPKRSIEGVSAWTHGLVDNLDYFCNPDPDMTGRTMEEEIDAKIIQMTMKNIDEMSTFLLSLEIV